MELLEGLGKLKKSTSSGTRASDLFACSIVPQPTTLPHAPHKFLVLRIFNKILCSDIFSLTEKTENILTWNILLETEGSLTHLHIMHLSSRLEYCRVLSLEQMS
jgi:hypothetical protein